MSHDDDPFGLSPEAREVAERGLARQSAERAALDSTSPTQVLFYHETARDFGFAWQALDAVNRWLFPVQNEGARFVYYILKRLQDQGKQAGIVLFATQGAGALFYVTFDTADQNSEGVVGMLPKDTQVFDFGTTVNSFAPQAKTTILSNQTAAENVYDGTTYQGTELVGLLATYVDGSVLASDQPVTCQADGTAVTTGNIWEGDPATSQATIKYPAPGGGQTQPFPL
jgi:hypothetical protein